jgi:hypothetical protein
LLDKVGDFVDNIVIVIVVLILKTEGILFLVKKIKHPTTTGAGVSVESVVMLGEVTVSGIVDTVELVTMVDGVTLLGAVEIVDGVTKTAGV